VRRRTGWRPRAGAVQGEVGGQRRGHAVGPGHLTALAHSVPHRPVAVLAYGSLLYRPGPELAAVTVARRPCRTPFPVEYGRASTRWGGGPVLAPHPDGG